MHTHILTSSGRTPKVATTPNSPQVRDGYGALHEQRIPQRTYATIKRIVADISTGSRDEHGGWSFGIESVGRHGWASLNWDVYGYRRDRHNRKLLAVVQVRQAVKRKSHYWTRVRKNYFLVGRNEDSTAFAHCVPSQVIHHAIKANREVVEACQTWIFGCDYSRVIRQGDLALVPFARLPVGAVEQTERRLTIADSHVVTADRFWKLGDNIYVDNPYLVHQPQTHAEVIAKGLHRLVLGSRAAAWSFSPESID